MTSRHPFGIGLGKSAAWIDGNLKFATMLSPGQGCTYEAPYTAKTSSGPFLYNLTSDPRESVDLKKSYPELYQHMLSSYEAWKTSVGNSTEEENLCGKQHGVSPA